MNKFLKLLTLALFVSSAASASIGNQLGDNGITLGYPSYGGNGCPGGSASASLSPDGSALSIIFDEFLVEAGGFSGKRMARKSCNISIPVHVPQGLSVSIVTVDYRGFVSVPRGGMARLSTEYFFAGSRGPRFNKMFRGGFEDDYNVGDQIGVVGLVWTPCGADTNLRVNTSMLARTNRYQDDVLATVDSADISSGLVYHLQWRRCY